VLLGQHGWWEQPAAWMESRVDHIVPPNTSKRDYQRIDRYRLESRLQLLLASDMGQASCCVQRAFVNLFASGERNSSLGCIRGEENEDHWRPPSGWLALWTTGHQNILGEGSTGRARGSVTGSSSVISSTLTRGCHGHLLYEDIRLRRHESPDSRAPRALHRPIHRRRMHGVGVQFPAKLPDGTEAGHQHRRRRLQVGLRHLGRQRAGASSVTIIKMFKKTRFESLTFLF